MGKWRTEQYGLFSAAADWFEKHWVIKTIITFLPTTWLPVIVKLFGVNWGLSNEMGTLSGTGKVITVFIYLLVFIVLVLGGKAAKSKNELQEEHAIELTKAVNGQLYLESILSGIDSVNKDICTDLLSKDNQNEDDNTSIDNLRIIAKSIQSCCSAQFNLSANKILVSMAYCIGSGDNSGEWKWANPQEVQGGLTLSELTSNRQTVFYSVMTGVDQFVFYNEKSLAIAANKYVPDERDKKHKNIGSIVVYDISAVKVADNKTIARAIVSISTFTKCISKATDEESIKEVEINLVGILDHYEDLIRKELAILASGISMAKQ